MVIKRESIHERLKNLDRIVQELDQYSAMDYDEYVEQLRHQWVIERGLIAAAGVILDIAEHILVGHFGEYSTSYENSLAGIHKRGVIADETYGQLKGLGGFRNILVHLYHEIDPEQVWTHYQKALSVFPTFAREVLAWMATIPSDE